MSFWKTLLGIGAEVVADSIPGGNSLIKVINAVVSDDKKVSDNVTGIELAKVVDTLSDADKIQVLDNYNAVLMNESDNFVKVQGVLAEVDKAGRSRRGEISLLFAKATVAWISVLVIAIAWVSYKNSSYPEEWVVGVILGYPFGAIMAYFGWKSGEIRKMTQAKSGLVEQAGAGLVSTIAKKFIK